jgi:hypothetical protein
MIIEIPRGREIVGAVTGAVLGSVMGAPWWALMLCAPAFTLVFCGLAQELSERRLSTFSMALVGSMVAVMAQ